MSFIVQCPYCNMRSRVPDKALGGSGKCSRCASFFTLTPADDHKQPELVGATAGPADPSSSDLEPVGSATMSSAVADLEPGFEPEAEAAATAADMVDELANAMATQQPAAENDGESSEPRQAAGAALPTWVSVWGFAALLLGGLALMMALLLIVRWLTIALAGLGLVSVAVGIALNARKPRPNDVLWLAAGGLLCLAILALAWGAPGILNRYWAMDAPVPKSDPHKMVAIARQGRVLAPEDAVDVPAEAIGQDDLVVRLLGVATGSLEENAENSFLLIHLRIGSSGQEHAITFTGFGNDKHRPTLKDSSGKPFPFLQQRARKVPAGGLIFLTEAPRTVEIRPMQFLDYQLVFETPEEVPFPVILELPAAAWNRKGVCRFRISGQFEPSVPESVKKKD